MGGSRTVLEMDAKDTPMSEKTKSLLDGGVVRRQEAAVPPPPPSVGKLRTGPKPAHRKPGAPRKLFEGPIVKRAIIESFKKLDPRHQLKNPVMFVVEVG